MKNIKRRIRTKDEKGFWNEAVKATLAEVKKYDGMIENETDRNFLVIQVTEKISYKLKT